MSEQKINFSNIDSKSEFIKILSQIQTEMEKNEPILSSEELENLEDNMENFCNQLTAVVIGQRIQSSMHTEEMKKEEKSIIESSPKKKTSNGFEEITIRLKCGVEIVIETRVFYGKGKAKKGRIVRPGLLLLGIHEKCTPGLASEISKTVTALGSMEEAKFLLENRGIDLSVSTIQNIAYCFGERVRMAQKMNSFEFNESVEGRVVCCGIDGGRIRIRKNKRGRKTKKNRSHYHTDWKEPKLLIIYVVNEEGRRDRQFCPIIDGTMKGPDAVFNLMHYYLVKLNITKADKIVFTADGAQWIWDRVGSLMASLKLKEDQIHLTLDFYHAVQHLNKIAKLCRKWSEKERKAWMNRQRRYLLKGKVDQMINEIRSLCKGRNSRSIRTELNYFIKHRYHI